MPISLLKCRATRNLRLGDFAPASARRSWPADRRRAAAATARPRCSPIRCSKQARAAVSAAAARRRSGYHAGPRAACTASQPTGEYGTAAGRAPARPRRWPALAGRPAPRPPPGCFRAPAWPGRSPDRSSMLQASRPSARTPVKSPSAASASATPVIAMAVPRWSGIAARRSAAHRKDSRQRQQDHSCSRRTCARAVPGCAPGPRGPRQIEHPQAGQAACPPRRNRGPGRSAWAARV